MQDHNSKKTILAGSLLPHMTCCGVLLVHGVCIWSLLVIGLSALISEDDGIALAQGRVTYSHPPLSVHMAFFGGEQGCLL